MQYSVYWTIVHSFIVVQLKCESTENLNQMPVCKLYAFRHAALEAYMCPYQTYSMLFNIGGQIE